MSGAASNVAGFLIAGTGSSNILTGNTAQGNNHGFLIVSGTNNTIIGNTAQGNASDGISFFSTSNNTVTGNTMQGNGGNGLNLSNSSNNTLTGNTSQGNVNGGLDLSSSSNNVVGSNKFHDNGGSSSNKAIYFAASDANTVTNNNITDTSCTTTCYAIDIASSTSDNNYLADNRHSGSTANPSTIQDLGTGTIYANQLDGSGNLINRNQAGFSVGKTSAGTSLDLQGALRATQLTTPASPTLTVVGTPGSTVYRYQVTALDGLGETLASTIVEVTNGNATLSATDRVNVALAQVGGAVQYRIYRCTGTGCTPALLATVASNIGTYQDTANGSPSGAMPTANTTGGASIAGAIQGSSTLTLGTSGSTNGSLVLRNASNSFTASLISGATTASYSMTLPVSGASGAQCLASTSGSTTTATALTFVACSGASSGATNLQGAYEGGNIIALGANGVMNPVLIRDNATPLAKSFAIQNSDGAYDYFAIASTGFNVQRAASTTALSFGMSDGILRVYDSGATTNYASISYSGNTAIFAASAGVTQIGTGSGSINMSLTAETDKLNVVKTFTPTAAYSTNDFVFSRNLSADANAVTGSLLTVEDLSTGSANSSVMARFNQNNSSATGDLLQLQRAGATQFSVSANGAITAAVTGNTINGLVINGGSLTNVGANITGSGALTLASGSTATLLTLRSGTGTAQISLDSSANTITLGVSDTVGTLLVLDTKTDAGDPTGANGGMYYNSNLGKFRCYENGACRNCLSSKVSSTIVDGLWASVAATNLAASTLNCVSDPSLRTVMNMSGLTKVRFMGKLGGTVVAATTMRLQYHTGGNIAVATGDAGWTTLDTSAGSHTAGAWFYSTEITIPTAAQADNMIIRACIFGGDGAADPTITGARINASN